MAKPAANSRLGRMEALLDELVIEMGFGQPHQGRIVISESATEAFVDHLADAVKRVQGFIADLHADGCCYDCLPALADCLTEREWTYRKRSRGSGGWVWRKRTAKERANG